MKTYACESIPGYRSENSIFNIYTVNSIKFEELWGNTSKSYFIEKWRGDPLRLWFAFCQDKCKGLKVPFVRISDNGVIGFDNGRHRTRWQLQNNTENIVIGLKDKDLKKAIEIGLEPKLFNSFI